MINSVLHGDCLELMKDIPDSSIDMVLTSPPYDNLRTYNGSLEWGDHIWKPVISELFRVIKKGAVVVWIVGDATINGSETGTSFRQALYAKDVGFNLHDTMIYHKQNLPKNHKRYEQDFEYMFVLAKGKVKTFKPIMMKNKQFGRGPTGASFRHDGKEPAKIHKDQPIKKERIKGNIWFVDCGYMRSTKDKIAFKHPAIFPEQLAYDQIVSWTNKGDLILDPFAGSGTTAVAAINTNRNYILMEKEAKYIDIINQRLGNHEPMPELTLPPQHQQLSLFA